MSRPGILLALLLTLASLLVMAESESVSAEPERPTGRTAFRPTSSLDTAVRIPAGTTDLMTEARSLERAGHAGCVDVYFAELHRRWWRAQELAGTSDRFAAALAAYNECLQDLLRTGIEHQRLDAAKGLKVRAGGQWTIVPVAHYGFVWTPADFQQLTFRDRNQKTSIRRYYAADGWGVPLVVQRQIRPTDPIEQEFYSKRSFFGATAILKFASSSPDGHGAESLPMVLEFHDPLRSRTSGEAPESLRLATDLTAPLAEILDRTERTYFAGFVTPGEASAAPRLMFLEPYQPGKVPVVLIHGLFSDPQSWADMINDLRATPGFVDHFQLWEFRYPTGSGFLAGATALRRELHRVVTQLDPHQQDPQLQQLVLIGHSMGGLMAKLQVTYSGEKIWQQVATRPIEEIQASEAVRMRLTQATYFDPSPNVTRVIFIATPHRGSGIATSVVGGCADLLVRTADRDRMMHDQLISQNPGAFRPAVERRFPTSVDLLAPDSPLLTTMQKLQISEQVTLHNIIGDISSIPFEEPTDGIVTVRSAEHPRCESTLLLEESHTWIHREQKASAEVWRILQLHLQQGRPMQIQARDLDPN